MKSYDIIIIGGGAAGLNVAMELANSNLSICMIEKEEKNTDDRTWCFWEKGKGKFDHILFHSWNKINFYAKSVKEGLDLDGYTYKMIRSSDFYKYAHDILDQTSNIDRIQSEVRDIKEYNDRVEVYTNGTVFKADKVLNSVIFDKPDLNGYNHVIQHFGGWFIETENDVFNDEACTFMDFRIPQNNDTRFFYVLPCNKRQALVEIAVFSNAVQKMPTYDNWIKEYIDTYIKPGNYRIEEKEIGQIPMTDYPFHKESSPRHIRIGTAGGWVKSSSGYAFKRIMERAEIVAHNLLNNKNVTTNSTRFHRWMDSVMLKAITQNYVSGKDVFESMFSKRSASDIFQFLDEKNSLWKNVYMMYSAPILPFSKAALF